MLLLLLIVLRFELINGGIKLLYLFIISLFSDPGKVWIQLDFSTIDLLISVILIFTIPVIIYKVRNRWEFFGRTVSLISFSIIVISIIFVFAPVITNYNPNFQNSLKVTRFLSPLQKVQKIYLKENVRNSNMGNFAIQKKKVIRSAVDEGFIYFNALTVKDDSVIISQSGVVKSFPKEKIVFNDGKPEVDSKIFLLGTDELGRDIFSRIVYGARISIVIGIFSVLLSLVLGLLFGFIAGYYGGYYDLVMSRITDMFMTVPSIFFIIMALAFFGNSLISIIVVLGFSGWMGLFKIVKGEIVLIKKKDYFVTSKKLKLPVKNLLFNEILPVMIIPVVVNVVFQFSNVILAESSLSYLGLGSGLNYPSWGSMILSGQHYMTQGWWLIAFPGFALIMTLLTFNLFGDKIKSYYNQTDNN
ncbi:Dipeptide transport system permease protein DppC (TC 3.A.1.5.2) [hydrothermal vent metagenome]|uniref:Dipeptide transport system permease protein DppC (TC 3.A.1.5.2) n=1 Tax=hydrothermal vent metagenome TaxID=652676 RepID=A0A3B1CD21_9ZZZZ